MYHFRRAVSGLLSLALTGSLCTAWLPDAAAAQSATPDPQTFYQTTGSIALTLRLGLPQSVEEADSRNLELHLSGSGTEMTLSLASGQAAGADGLRTTVEKRSVQGAPLTTETQLGSYQAAISGLPLGTYTLSLTGRGYAACTTQVTLQDYSQRVLVSTDNGTFSLGDVDGSGKVDAADRAALDAQLGKTEALDIYDLNGDGVVDITDLSYVNRMMDRTAQPQILSTTAIVSAQVEDQALTVTSGDLKHLFSDAEEETVTLAPAQSGGEISIPIALSKPTEMSEISITSPHAAGAVRAGTAVVETQSGETLTIPFDNSAPAGVHAISRAAGQNTVTINLGQKVMVKKVTITVSKVEGQTGDKPEFATVTQIQFLKDIASEDAAADTQVKGVAATPGDKEVSLSWSALNNVTGYLIQYGTSQNSLNQSLSVSTNQATVSGLTNNKTYYFQVTGVNGDWKGTPSQVVSATPAPASVPGAPSNLVVQSADSALRLSWGSTKDATYYQVFYRTKGSASFQAWGGDTTATSAVITGLTNGTEYEVAVKAGNQNGVGPYSAIALGTPKAEMLEMPELPTNGRIDNGNITSVVMADSGNVNKGLCPSFTVKDLTDNNPNTYWIAANYWYDSNITYTFQNTYDMNYLLVVPYLDGAYKNRIDNYTVTLRGADGETLATYYRSGVNITGSNYYIVTFPETEGVKSVTLGLGEKTGGPRVSISEIAFYESDTLSADIAALFTDGSFTALRGGVEEFHITALRERLAALSSFYLDVNRLTDELNLAQGLLEHNENALGLVKNDFQSRSASAAADRAAGQTASDLQPLGITAAAGATVAIYAQIPDDATVYVVPTQFYGESGVWKGAPVALEHGRNYITIDKIGSLSDTRGGMLYLTYAGSRPQDIKLQVRVLQNAWEMPVLELSDWYTMDESERRDAIRAYVQELSTYVGSLSSSGLTTNIRNATEISTPSVLLSLPADQVLSGLKGVGHDESAMVETMYQNVLAWEEELFIANKVQGIIDSNTPLADYQYPMTTRQNIRYMRMFAGAFMYAAGNHVGVEYGSTSALVQGKPTSATGEGRANGLFGWGIAHEIGHNMDKLGKAECTNNIYSLFLQAWDGGSMALNTRLTEDGRWEDIFNKTAQSRPGSANNVFVQLGLYWQLHLAYDDSADPLAFYNEFFTRWKEGQYSSYTYDERVALIASQVANRNLTEFFTRWGMELSSGVKSTLSGYPQERRAVWYLNDASRTYRLEGGSAASGEATVTASVQASNVTLTMSHPDSSRILGYEIRRNGVAIAFTTQNTYVDNLGAANNLTYTYSVVPVDKLGNLGAEAKADEVRVAYDKTIDQNLYDLERLEDGTLILTMKSGSAVPVTGIKVTGTDLSGTYTVQVKADPDAEDWTDAKTGELSGETVVAYFNKPGAEPSDTRIWTYDAAVVKLTGIPEDAQVELLDYPGDRVDFYEGAAVGVLKESYGGIPAGTLVILGTYRGDPVYNYVEIEARYSTTPEAGAVTTIERPIDGEVYLLAEIPADGAVSDTSDGFFLFVPNLEWEKELNQQSGVTDNYPLEIRANFYRTDHPNDPSSKRLTSQTLWLSFPEGGEDHSFPLIELIGND